MPNEVCFCRSIIHDQMNRELCAFKGSTLPTLLWHSGKEICNLTPSNSYLFSPYSCLSNVQHLSIVLLLINHRIPNTHQQLACQRILPKETQRIGASCENQNTKEGMKPIMTQIPPNHEGMLEVQQASPFHPHAAMANGTSNNQCGRSNKKLLPAHSSRSRH